MCNFVKISQNYHVLNHFLPKFANESQQKSALSVKKGDFEPQHLTLRTIAKPYKFEHSNCS